VSWFKKNRRREPLRLGTVAKSVMACVCLAVMGLVCVWQKNQIYRLGEDLRKREAYLLALEKRNSQWAAQLAHLKSPSYLEAQCRQYSLGLVMPKETQIIRAYEPGPEWDMPMGRSAVVRTQAPVGSPRKRAATVVRR
jgi:cell division protein FtsB